MNRIISAYFTHKRKAIIVYGTSLSAERTVFWRRVSGQWVGLLKDWLEDHWPGRYRVINASRWGATSQWAEAHLQKRVLRHNPACVILEFAINDADVNRSIDLAAARNHLQKMTAAIRQRAPDCRVVVMLTNPCFGRYAGLRPRLADYYAAYREHARANGLDLIDLNSAWERWLAAHPDRRSAYLPDGLHPAAEASRELVFPQVREHLQTRLQGIAGS